MNLSPTAHALYEAIAALPVVDAHEHLPPEKDYLAAGYSGLNLFAGGYIWHDLESAGLPAAFKAAMREGGFRPVETWWPVIRPFWEQVCHTSFARALRITARDLFGLPEINDRTIADLAAAVQAANRPGLYRRVLRERCGIRVAITCVDRPDFPGDPLLRGITQLEKAAGAPAAIARELSARSGREVRSLEDAVGAAQALLRRDLERGALGFKTMVADRRAPSPEAALRAWRAGQESAAVGDLLFDRCLDVAAAAGVPVAVHTGYWGDFRKLDPKCLLSFALRRPDVRFDLFHLGMPMIRDALLIGKSLPNVTLNLAWCPVISQVQTARALDELLDLAPLNKIIAFGGDYRVAVQKVYGHLVMAREVVAEALGRRVDAGGFDADEALRIARLWFHDNPARIYGLPSAGRVCPAAPLNVG